MLKRDKPGLFRYLQVNTVPLLKYFKSSLPTAKSTGISEVVIREASTAVLQVDRAIITKPTTERTA